MVSHGRLSKLFTPLRGWKWAGLTVDIKTEVLYFVVIDPLQICLTDRAQSLIFPRLTPMKFRIPQPNTVQVTLWNESRGKVPDMGSLQIYL